MSFGWSVGDGTALLHQAGLALQSVQKSSGGNYDLMHELASLWEVIQLLRRRLASSEDGHQQAPQDYSMISWPLLQRLDYAVLKLNRLLDSQTTVIAEEQQRKSLTILRDLLSTYRSDIVRMSKFSFQEPQAERKLGSLPLDNTTNQQAEGAELGPPFDQESYHVGTLPPHNPPQQSTHFNRLETSEDHSSPSDFSPDLEKLADQLSALHLSSSDICTSLIPYSSLDEDEDEIRLINILPYTGDSTFVRCMLSTVSLKALTSEYQGFLSASSPTLGSMREKIASWGDISSPSKSSSHGNPMDKHIPTESNYRFKWGDYATLSYVWGDPSLTRRIIVNDQETQVGCNLEVALRTLSKRQDFHEGFKLWVDAICINQADYNERGRQITKMREIYGDAWTVIAWLGEEKNNSTKALQLVQSLSDTSPEHGEEMEARLLVDPDYLGSGCWMALEALMSREYWYRLWIIQELVLGSSALVLRCGDDFIEWTAFCRGIGFLFDYLWTVKDSLLLHEMRARNFELGRSTVWSTTSLHLVRQDLWPLSQYGQQGRGRLDFSRLLTIANSAESRDARDYVYGLVGMMDPAIAEQITPNYRSPLSEVFASAAKIFIFTDGSLDPIREGNPWSQTSTPSWAADWTWNGRLRHRYPETYLWGPFWTQKGLPHAAEPAIPYRASGETVPEALFSDSDLRLTCRGFVVDSIDGLAARERGYFEWSERSIIQPDQGTNIYGNFDGVAKALYHALIADRVSGGQRASERHAAVLNLPSTFTHGSAQFRQLGWKWLSQQRGYYFRWEKWRLANRDFHLMGRRLDDYFSDTIPEGASEYDYTEVYSCVDRTGKGRRFMTTAKGYLGWAPDNLYGDDEAQTRRGDLIAIIFGCTTPLVIRPHGAFYQVVGEAYVQGLMDGETLEFLRTGQCVAEDFTFC